MIDSVIVGKELFWRNRVDRRYQKRVLSNMYQQSRYFVISQQRRFYLKVLP